MQILQEFCGKIQDKFAKKRSLKKANFAEIFWANFAKSDRGNERNGNFANFFFLGGGGEE